MKKEEFAAKLAISLGTSKKQALELIETTFSCLSDALENGEDVKITGFGTFSVRKRAGFRSRHPKTGKELEIPEGLLPTFEPSKQLKEKVNRANAAR